MNSSELIKVTGALSIVLTNENGQVKSEIQIPNLVVTVGKEHIVSRMLGASQNVMSHMAIGTGVIAPSLTDVSLGSELTRISLSATTGTSLNIASYSATFGPGVGTGAITEAGILNAASSGVMLARTTFAAVNKAAGDTLSITWNVTIA